MNSGSYMNLGDFMGIQIQIQFFLCVCFFVVYRHFFFGTMDKDWSAAVRFTNFNVPSDCFPESHGIPESRNQQKQRCT